MATSKYDTVVDLAARNNSHTLMVELVGTQKRVLDVGCANGYLAEVLRGHDCTVSGVEYDAAAAEQARPHLERLVVGDLEDLDLVAELGEGQFDVIVFGDVLEHLRDPLPVLKQARPLLAPGGYVVISIPNVAHGAVRLSLLKGRFDYGPLGLLDETHIRFFTRDNLRALLHDAGLAPTDFLRTTAGVFETELKVSPDEFDPALVEQVLADPDATTYQFVVRAVPDDAAYAVTAMRQQFEQRLDEAARQIEELTGRVGQAEQDCAGVRAELATAREQLARRDEQAVELRRQLQEMHDLKTMRATRSARRVYGAVRRTGGA